MTAAAESNTTPVMTDGEVVFVRRMLPHFMAGKSVEDAAAAVLADDERLFLALFDRSHSEFVPTADERGLSHTTRVGKGDVIATEMAGEVYRRIRAAA